MGGLDSRFALHENLSGLAARVASLSTIATPHFGSPVADFLGGGGLLGAVFSGLGSAVAAFGVPTGALHDLTTAKAAQFNRDHPNIGTIPCHCYAGNGLESPPLALMREYIRHVGKTDAEKENDGLVSVASASWKPLAEPPWPTDHIGEVGHNATPPRFASRFDHLAAFRRVVARATGG
jgi:triacylglycerol lipase